jgi:hypothetical protein
VAPEGGTLILTGSWKEQNKTARMAFPFATAGRPFSVTAISLVDVLPRDPGDDGEFDPMFLLSEIFSDRAPAFLFAAAPVVGSHPTAVTTADFPDVSRPPAPASVRGRKRPRGVQCCICLESVAPSDRRQIRLPCGHAFHGVCAYNLLNGAGPGAGSMMRCPLCRRCVDRYDLQGILGPERVGPTALRRVSRCCSSFRSLLTGAFAHAPAPAAQVAARLVQRCSQTQAADGFVYNCCVLAIDRALFHRCNLVRVIDAQLRDRRAGERGAPLDVCAFVDNTVACHLEVLMRTAAVPDEP